MQTWCLPMPRLWFQQGELERIEDFDDASLVFKA